MDDLTCAGCGEYAGSKIADRIEADAARIRELEALVSEARETLRVNLIFADKISEAADIDPEETALGVKVMPEGREVARKTWAEVMEQTRALLARMGGEHDRA